MTFVPPGLLRTDHDEASVFVADNLLREARRQMALPEGPVPRIGLLDPDGDVANYLLMSGKGVKSSIWACYHTDMIEADLESGPVGVIPHAVGAAFAVLVAEELFASGCELLISLTSAGRIASDIPQSSLMVIDRALRGEGTSYAYLPPNEIVDADQCLAHMAYDVIEHLRMPVIRGTVWTTDAPFRETGSSIEAAKQRGALAVEMEAAGLYAFSAARGYPVICLAHVTNDMAVETGDFDKGVSNGALQALSVVNALSAAWQGHPRLNEEQV